MRHEDEYSPIYNASYPVKCSLFSPDMHERIRVFNEPLRVARPTRRFQPLQDNKKGRFLGVNKGLRRGEERVGRRYKAITNLLLKRAIGVNRGGPSPGKKISQVSVSTCSSMLREGKIKRFVDESKYNSAPFILSCVNGCKLFFLLKQLKINCHTLSNFVRNNN